jgi:hypothetical protein
VKIRGKMNAMSTVFAAAGRRIDAADANPARFPLENVALVRQRVHDLLEASRATAVIASAACGADLIALDEAGRLGARRRIFLPFASDRFRATSVTDRPGDWGPLYERILREVGMLNDVTTLAEANAGFATYLSINDLILDDAQRIARTSGADAAAVLIWEGRARELDDLTQAFGDSARARGMSVFETATLL